ARNADREAGLRRQERSLGDWIEEVNSAQIDAQVNISAWGSDEVRIDSRDTLIRAHQSMKELIRSNCLDDLDSHRDRLPAVSRNTDRLRSETDHRIRNVEASR